MTVSRFVANVNANIKKFSSKMKEAQRQAAELQEELVVKVVANVKDIMKDFARVEQAKAELARDVVVKIEANLNDFMQDMLRARAQAQEMSGEEIKIRIKLNLATFYTQLNTVKAELKALAKDAIKIKLKLDTSSFNHSYALVQGLLSQLNGQDANIQLQASNADALAAVGQVQAALATLTDTVVDIRADITNFLAGLAVVNQQSQQVDRKNIVVKVWLDFTNAMQSYANVVRAFEEVGQQMMGGALMAFLPALVPIVSVLIGLVGNLGVALGVAATSAFALVTAVGAAAIAAGAFAAVAIPTIKNLFDETAKLNAQQQAAKQSFDDFKATYDSLVKATEKPVLDAFTSAMNAANKVLKHLEPMFMSVSEAVAGLMESLNQSIDSKPIQDLFAFLNKDAAGLLTTVVEAVGYLFQGLLSMMTAFAPLTIDTANGFRDMSKGFAEWAAGLSESDRFKALIDYTNKYMPIMRQGFKDLIVGVVEFFAAFAGQSESFIQGFANMMSTFREWASTLGSNKSFQSFLRYIEEATPKVLDLIGSLWKFIVQLGAALAPVGLILLDVASSFFSWAASVLESNKLIATLVGWLPVLIGVVTALVPIIVGAVAVFGNLRAAFVAIRGVIAGFNLVAFVGSLGGALSLLVNPVTLTVAALAGLGVGVKLLSDHLSGSSIQVTSWKDSVSEATALALGSFMDLSENATLALSQMAWSGQTVTQEMATNLIATYQQMGDQVLAEMQSDHAEQYTALQTHFSNSSALTEAEEADILAKTLEYQAGKEAVVSDGQARIAEILNAASTEKRAITQAEQQEINAIQETMKDNAIVYMTQNEAEQKAIYESMKSQASEISALQAAEVVKNAVAQKEEVIAEAEQQYKESVAEIIKLRDEAGAISAEQADKLIEEATRTRDETVSSAEDMHANIVKEAKAQAGEHVSQVNWETGEIKSKWASMKTDVTTKMKEIGASIKKDWSEAYTNAKKSVSDMLTATREKFTEMKTAVSDKMTEAKEAVETKWNEAVSFLEGIDLSKTGEWIVQGLANGIEAGYGWVKKKVEGLAALIPDWAADILGIHSPSRVMAALGKWIPAGLAKGVTGSLDLVKKASAQMAQAVVPDFKESYKASKNMLDDIADMTKNNAKKSNDDKMQAFKDYLSKQKDNYDISASYEAVYWKQVAATFKDGSSEKIKALKNHQIANEQVLKEQFEAEKFFIEKSEKYANLSLANKLEALQQYAKGYAKNSEEQLYYEEEVYATKKGNP